MPASRSLSAISVATSAFAGLVAWPRVVAMLLSSTAGGCVGAPNARALPRRMVRGPVVFLGASMSAIFFARLLGR